MNDPVTPLEFGHLAEDVVKTYLERHGMLILERNYHSRQGEIDLVCRDGKTVIFVEVKGSYMPQPYNIGERVNRRKMIRIVAAARDYLQRRDLYDIDARFDVITAQRLPSGEWRIDHIADAFNLDDIDRENT